MTNDIIEYIDFLSVCLFVFVTVVLSEKKVFMYRKRMTEQA